jgi:hypothetical protein
MLPECKEGFLLARNSWVEVIELLMVLNSYLRVDIISQLIIRSIACCNYDNKTYTFEGILNS